MSINKFHGVKCIGKFIPLIIIIITLNLTIILYKLQYIDAFHYLTLSNVNEFLNSNNNFQIIQSIDFPGDELLIIIIAELTNYPIINLSNLPIGAILVPLCYFTLSRKLIKNTYLAFFIAIYSAIDPLILLGSYSTFNYAWTRPLFLLFLFVYYRYIFEKRMKSDFLILLIIFSFLYLTHPTYAMWSIFFSISLILSMLLFPPTILNKYKIIPSYITPMIFLIIFLSFNSVIYKQLVPKIFNSEYNNALDFFICQIHSIVGGSGVSEKYLLTSVTSPIWDISRTLRLIIIVLPVVLFCLVIIKDILWNNRDNRIWKSNKSSFIVANIFTGILGTVAYITYGHVSFRYIIFIMPIISFMCLALLTQKKVILQIFICLLLLASTISLLSSLDSPVITKTGDYDKIKYSSLWAMGKINSNEVILTDLNTLFAYFMTDYHRNLNYLGYNSHNYDSLVNLDYDKLDYDYVIMNNQLKDAPTVALGWEYYEPLINYDQNISINTNINLVYNDYFIYIYQST